MGLHQHLAEKSTKWTNMIPRTLCGKFAITFGTSKAMFCIAVLRELQRRVVKQWDWIRVCTEFTASNDLNDDEQMGQLHDSRFLDI